MAAVATPPTNTVPSAPAPQSRSFVPIRPAFRPLLPKPIAAKPAGSQGPKPQSCQIGGLSAKNAPSEPLVKLKIHQQQPQITLKASRKRKSEPVLIPSTISPASLMAKRRRNTEPLGINSFEDAIVDAKSSVSSAICGTAPVSMAVGSPDPSLSGSSSDQASSCASPASLTCARSGATPTSLSDLSGFPATEGVASMNPPVESSTRLSFAKKDLSSFADSGLFSPVSGQNSMSSPSAVGFELSILDFEVENAGLTVNTSALNIGNSVASLDSPPSNMDSALEFDVKTENFSLSELDSRSQPSESMSLAAAEAARVQSLQTDTVFADAQWQSNSLQSYTLNVNDELNIDQLTCDELAAGLDYFSPPHTESNDVLEHMDFLGQPLEYL